MDKIFGNPEQVVHEADTSEGFQTCSARMNVERDRISTLYCHCGRWYGDIPDRLAQGNCVSLRMFVISISCSLLKRGHLDWVLAQREPQPRAIVIVPSNPGDDAPIGADTDQHM